jgi:hypothetical protein
MLCRIGSILTLIGILVALLSLSRPSPACCPAPRSGEPVVNADQTVILLWDPATKTEHFIRRASFKSQGDDFGFLAPSPSRPELDESGNAAFPALQKLTEPERRKASLPSGGVGCIGCGRSASSPAGKASALPAVRVLEEKLVAGFKASVLEADNTDVLVRWLKDNGYAFSPEVQAWAAPYVKDGWKMTALKVAKPEDGKKDEGVTAAALRISFKTDRPLFPYREPDPTASAAALKTNHRLLRIYFLSDVRYQGVLTKDTPWTGKVAWAGKLSAEDRKKTLELLKLPESTGPAEWWLTEFEDDWPYRPAPADVYFSRGTDQSEVRRPPIIEYVSTFWPTDATVYALAFALVAPPLVRRIRRGEKR